MQCSRSLLPFSGKSLRTAAPPIRMFQKNEVAKVEKKHNKPQEGELVLQKSGRGMVISTSFLPIEAPFYFDGSDQCKILLALPNL